MLKDKGPKKNVDKKGLFIETSYLCLLCFVDWERTQDTQDVNKVAKQTWSETTSSGC